MKLKLINTLFICTVSLSLAACTDWLTEERPNSTSLKDFFITTEAARQAVNGCYAPISYEFDGTYFNEWIVGDIASDDSIKGGQTLGESPDIYDIENFKTVPSNGMLLSFYRAQFLGIARCNEAISSITAMDESYIDEPNRAQLIAEAKFLRAYYYFRLVRMYGGVPMPLAPVTSSDDWKMPRESAETIYAQIEKDFTDAEAVLPERDGYAADDLGRATKGAAQAMLMKINLYQKKYDKVLQWGKKIITEVGGAGKYELVPNFFSQFYLANEWGTESVWEVQYVKDIMSDYSGLGQVFGNFTAIQTRSRSEKLGGTIIVNTENGTSSIQNSAGWGYNKPSQDLYDEFEAGDPRREWTIVTPTDAEITNASDEIHYGNRYIGRKYMYECEVNNTNGIFRFELPFLDGNTPMRCPLNRKEIRYSDVLLMYAEAAIESGQETDTAKALIDKVRARVGLPAVAAATREALRHERRVELAMEGHRWFDLVRWGIAAETMNAYAAKYTTANGAATTEGDAMAPFIAGKHELMPIPQEEIRLSGITQNPNY